MLKGVDVRIVGVSPLLMHAFPMQPVEALEKKTPEEQAEHSAYRRPITGELYVPAVALQRALIAGATYCKGKGRGSLQKAVAACVLATPEYLVLSEQVYTIDVRPVVIPATKGRILRYRPRFDAWSIQVILEYDDVLLTLQQVRDVVDATGSRTGLLDFRPEKKGPFGRFRVDSWNPN